jgi:hypothetical protein
MCFHPRRPSAKPCYLEQVHNAFVQMVNLSINFITDKYKERGIGTAAIIDDWT